jgi:hypothetical protein
MQWGAQYLPRIIRKIFDERNSIIDIQIAGAEILWKQPPYFSLLPIIVVNIS